MTDKNLSPLPYGHYVKTATIKRREDGSLLGYRTQMYLTGLYVALTVDGNPAGQLPYTRSGAMAMGRELIKTIVEHGDEVLEWETADWETESLKARGL